jgi:hypothetical protein
MWRNRRSGHGVDTADGVARRLAGGMANGVDAVDKVDTAD